MTKGCDHEIVRALEIHPNTVPWNNELQYCVVTGFKCIVKTYAEI